MVGVDVVGVQIEHGHPGTGTAQLRDRGSTDSARATGDECGRAVDLHRGTRTVSASATHSMVAGSGPTRSPSA